MTDKIVIDRAVVEQALEALEFSETPSHRPQYEVEVSASIALRAALEQPQVEQEPVAEVIESHVRAGLDGLFTAEVASRERLSVGAELFIHPQPPRQPLTLDQILDAIRPAWSYPTCTLEHVVRAIERAHGIGGEA